MLVVAAAMIAPVSSKACSLRQSAERKTSRSAKDGSAQVLAQARHPATVWSRTCRTAGTESRAVGCPQLTMKKRGSSTRIERPGRPYRAGRLPAPPTTKDRPPPPRPPRRGAAGRGAGADAPTDVRVASARHQEPVDLERRVHRGASGNAR